VVTVTLDAAPPPNPGLPLVIAALLTAAVILTVSVLLLVPALNGPARSTPPLCTGCPSAALTPLPDALGLGAPFQSLGAGMYWYNLSVVDGGDNLTWGALELSLENPNGSTVTNGTWAAVAAAADGTYLGFYRPMIGWQYGSGNLVTEGQILAVETIDASFAGDYLVVAGLPPFSGSITVGLP
jgi:hypothetical protein